MFSLLDLPWYIDSRWSYWCIKKRGVILPIFEPNSPQWGCNEGCDEGCDEGSDEGSDKGCNEGSDEGGEWLILSCLRGFEDTITNGQLWL